MRWLEREVNPEDQPAEVVEQKEVLIKVLSLLLLSLALFLTYLTYSQWAAMSLYGGSADIVSPALQSLFKFWLILAVPRLFQRYRRSLLPWFTTLQYKQLLKPK